MRFISADFIFDGSHFLQPAQVLVLDDNDRILEIVSGSSVTATEHFEGMLLPGLVNAHCHLELSHMKGQIERHTGLVNFLLQVNQRRHNTSEEEKRLAIEQAEASMMMLGIVAVGDISNTLDTLQTKQQKHLRYHTFVECFGLLENNASARFNDAITRSHNFSLFHPSSVTLHAPYSVTDSLLKLVNQAATGKILSIHNQECEAENELFISGAGSFHQLFEAILGQPYSFTPSGKSSLQTYLSKLDNAARILLVHNTVSSTQDIEFAAQLKNHVSWCLCPNANLYIENQLPDIPLLIEHGCHIVLGTDSLASNHALNLFEEILTLQAAFPQITLEEKLTWATRNGAEALGINDKLGELKAGKKPGIIQVKNLVNKHVLPAKPDIQVVIAAE